MTGVILGAITAASFAVWMVPQNTQTQFVVSDAGADLDAIIEQKNTISETTIAEFNKMLGNEITPDNYISIAKISSSQINALIIKIMESDVPQEWKSSYSLLADSLRAHNSYIRETIIVTEKVKADPAADTSQEMISIDSFLREADNLLADSNGARPS
jgi:hypothetical protein